MLYKHLVYYHQVLIAKLLDNLRFKSIYVKFGVAKCRIYSLELKQLLKKIKYE
ncbi:hypothetical protein GXM_05326 [Nostoc sphaeroides CCNUC1]|uniref:Uncharacterized protein n=1 Tax=Nostoc sphaeroides CCNUC1 TaxID=2653204 RepID=A0A5P8W5A9_9NOSO|nr:hypothetical protein GXM_05326 [Nostoc sphaeroides CCNUC1]